MFTERHPCAGFANVCIGWVQHLLQNQLPSTKRRSTNGAGLAAGPPSNIVGGKLHELSQSGSKKDLRKPTAGQQKDSREVSTKSLAVDFSSDSDPDSGVGDAGTAHQGHGKERNAESGRVQKRREPELNGRSYSRS